MALSTWLVEHLAPDPDGALYIQDILDKLDKTKAKINFGQDNSTIRKDKLGITVQRIFGVVPKRKTKEKLTFYALQWKNLPQLDAIFSTDTIADLLTSKYVIKKTTELVLEAVVNCNVIANGNEVNKTVIFEENQFSVQIRGTKVDLNSLGVSDKYTCCSEGIETVCKLVEAIILCEGVEIGTKKVEYRNRYFVEELRTSERDSKTILRSNNCKQAVSFTFMKHQQCLICKRQTISYKTKAPEKSDTEKIKDIMPNATEAMLTLVMSQVRNIKNSHATQNRWEKPIMNECLNWYTRSPLSYIQIRQSGLILLPSLAMLLLYKNSVQQKPGLSDEIFHWMDQEATRMQLKDSGRIGGILLDEMSIQQKIELEKHGSSIEMVGFVDMGEESEDLSSLRDRKKSKKIGSHCLQFLFQGITGFRFPFAHFVSDQVNACELYILVWDSVKRLSEFGFKTKYICMDGAISNRSFMNLHFASDSIEKRMKAMMPCNPTEEMIFLMDPSHTFKKIRNNVIKSGNEKHSTRLIQLPSGKSVQWSMWKDAFIWDKTNPIQIHKSLSDAHIFPSQSDKMRNKLAEDALNADMLTLMEAYQQHIGSKGSELDGAIDLLQNTSVLIDVFRDRRPVTEANDIRLAKLNIVQQWFHHWYTQAKSKKSIMSDQCHEDVQSSIIGFMELCNFMIESHPGCSVVPAMINSDAIENVFCQHRGKFNGLNTNPTALQYRRNINGVILGQSAVSRKGNDMKVQKTTENFAFSLNKHVRNQNGKRTAEISHVRPIKCIRM